MAFPAFDDYLTVLGKCLRTGRGRRSEIACELSDHLQQRLAELTASGMSQEEAARRPWLPNSLNWLTTFVGDGSCVALSDRCALRWWP